jgi:hypothetical protein
MTVYKEFMQGSAAWKKIRLGIPTASNFDCVMPTKRGYESTRRKGYMHKLIAESLLGRPADTLDGQPPVSGLFWPHRGIVMEPRAADELEKMQIGELEQVGFITTKDGTLGCSPDRLIKGRNEAVEIKCPAAHTQIEYLLAEPEYWIEGPYKPQVQGQMLVGGFERVFFYSWHPRMPAKLQVTYRDDAYIDKMRGELLRFIIELNAAKILAREMGVYTPYQEGEEP